MPRRSGGLSPNSTSLRTQPNSGDLIPGATPPVVSRAWFALAAVVVVVAVVAVFAVVDAGCASVVVTVVASVVAVAVAVVVVGVMVAIAVCCVTVMRFTVSAMLFGGGSVVGCCTAAAGAGAADFAHGRHSMPKSALRPVAKRRRLRHEKVPPGKTLFVPAWAGGPT